MAALVGVHAHQPPTEPTAASTPAAPAAPSGAATASAAAPTTPSASAGAAASRRTDVSRSAPRVDRRAPQVVAPRRFERAKPRPEPRPRTPLAASNASRTVAAALDSTSNVPGRCLQWSREQAGVPSRYRDATAAWEHATGRHPSDVTPPRGAAVYWTGGSAGHGHVAISVGGGKVRSSDAGGAGRVATVPIAQITDDWNLEYAGWADSINGYTIPGVTPA